MSKNTAKKNNSTEKGNIFSRLSNAINFCVSGVWRSPKNTFWIRTLKTANLSVRSFLDRGLQIKSMALTYCTVLAIVPAFALIFAMGRGFGFQNLLKDEIFAFFPAQKQAVATAFSFVDSYLNEASQGVFIGVGIIVLLWTLISLLSNIEDAFNNIWDIKRERSIYQKLTDYIAICLIVPILMICSSGISIFLATTLEEGIQFPFLTTLINIILEGSPVILTWLAFTMSFYLIPNTKVKFKYACLTGLICSVMFQILQQLFLNGQIYVSKYNAIYGSFAFLPLLLIWLEFSWLILLFGCALTYSMQNVFLFNYEGEVSDISDLYMRKIAIGIMSVIIYRFEKGLKPMTPNEISITYRLPIRLVNSICEKLHNCHLIYFVQEERSEIGIAPSFDTDSFTIGELFKKLDNYGESDFIPDFNKIFEQTNNATENFIHDLYDNLPDTVLKNIPPPNIPD